VNRNDFADLFPLWKQAFAGNFGKAIVDIVPPPAYLSTAACVVPTLASKKALAVSAFYWVLFFQPF
jgi:hypothetical protein